jgi:hypothetical protein
LLITEINSQDLGWKADTCKYQKKHPLYGKDCGSNDKTLSLAQTSDYDLVELEDPAIKPFGNKDDAEFTKTLKKA